MSLGRVRAIAGSSGGSCANFWTIGLWKRSRSTVRISITPGLLAISASSSAARAAAGASVPAGRSLVLLVAAEIGGELARLGAQRRLAGGLRQAGVLAQLRLVGERAAVERFLRGHALLDALGLGRELLLGGRPLSLVDAELEDLAQRPAIAALGERERRLRLDIEILLRRRRLHVVDDGMTRSPSADAADAPSRQPATRTGRRGRRFQVEECGIGEPRCWGSYVG